MFIHIYFPPRIEGISQDENPGLVKPGINPNSTVLIKFDLGGTSELGRSLELYWSIDDHLLCQFKRVTRQSSQRTDGIHVMNGMGDEIGSRHAVLHFINPGIMFWKFMKKIDAFNIERVERDDIFHVQSPQQFAPFIFC